MYSAIKCPHCTSQKVWKAGIRKTQHGDIQRWLCRCCGYRFSFFKQSPVPQLQIKKNVIFQPFMKLHSRSDFAKISVSHSASATKKVLNDLPFSICEDVSSHNSPAKSTVGKSINGFASTIVNAKYALGKKAKNLVKVEPQIEGLAGATADLKTPKEKIVAYTWWLKKQGYAESTIIGRVKLLRQMVKRGGDLDDPETIKDTIARQDTWSKGRKELAVECYTNYLLFSGGTWNPPRYKRVKTLPFIPSESELDQLIAGCGAKTGTFLQVLKETGARCGEAWQLEWIDMDTREQALRFKPEKQSNPRMLKISGELIERLQSLPHKSNQIFGGTQLRTTRRIFEHSKKRLARKTKNPRLRQITFHTFRHWKATMEYHRTKDILHVMRLLGHRSIQNTLVYTQLVNFKTTDFISRVAWNVEEACKLVEAGFEFVCELDNGRIFRKPK